MIEISTAFKKDYKRAKANPRHAKDIRSLYENISLLLAEDKSLPDNCRDHALAGDWNGYRECHLKPDLLLIYQREDTDILKIARLGSHSELFSRWGMWMPRWRKFCPRATIPPLSTKLEYMFSTPYVDITPSCRLPLYQPA